jgi:hypothetical protein
MKKRTRIVPFAKFDMGLEYYRSKEILDDN